MRSSLSCLLSLFCVLLVSGCAGVISPRNYGGRSAIQQRLVAETIDESVGRLGIGSRFSDQYVYLQIGDLDAEGVASDYVRAAVLQELLRAEATVTDNAMEADEQLVVKVRAAGADNSEPPKGLFPLLIALVMYEETMTAQARLESVAASVERGSGRVVPNSADTLSGSATNTYKETWYLFGMFGPIVSSTVPGW